MRITAFDPDFGYRQDVGAPFASAGGDLGGSFPSPSVVRSPRIALDLTNQSGADVAAGDVVVLDTAHDDAFTTTTTASFTGAVGIAQADIVAGAAGSVLLSGYAPLVNVTASVTRGHYGATSTTVKKASDAGTSRASGTFCQFLTGGTAPDAVLWMPDAFPAAFANPMTTQDDIIVGGASPAGGPTRLGKGSDGQVLTVDPTTHHLVWASPTGGMSNPMTTVGDLIVGGTVTGGVAAPARLGVGTATQLLHGGTTPAYSAVLPADLDVSADNTTADATTGHHGLLPKLGGGTTNFLRADGSWASPGGGSSPLTTKGDVWGYSTADARIPVGSNGQVLTADSTQALGVAWAAPAAPSIFDGKPYIWTPPTSANAKDDEFSDYSGQSGPVNGLDAKWSKRNLGTSTWLRLSDSYAPGCLMFDIPTGQTVDQWIYQSISAGAQRYMYRIALQYASDRQIYFIAFLDSSGNGVGLRLDTGDQPYLGEVSAWQQTGSVTAASPDVRPMWDGNQHVGSGHFITVFLDWDGNTAPATVTAVLTAGERGAYGMGPTTSRTKTFTPDRIAIGRGYGSGVSKALVECFRKVA